MVWVGSAPGQSSIKNGLAQTELRSRGHDWPWKFYSEQYFGLEPDRLNYELSISNTDSSAMPAGLGLHPFFPTNVWPECRVCFREDGNVARRATHSFCWKGRIGPIRWVEDNESVRFGSRLHGAKQ